MERGANAPARSKSPARAKKAAMNTTAKEPGVLALPVRVADGRRSVALEPALERSRAVLGRLPAQRQPHVRALLRVEGGRWGWVIPPRSPKLPNGNVLQN